MEFYAEIFRCFFSVADSFAALNLVGIVTPMTFSFPRASTAKQAVSEESMPPLKPIITF